jgi:hypothetical protein
MIKITLDFQTTLDVSTIFSRTCGLKKLIPFKDGRAVIFGWGTIPGNYQIGPHQYWLAEINREGTSHRALPVEMTNQTERLMAPLAARSYIQAFKFGEKFGLLISTEIILLFSTIHDDPIIIPIENHFSVLGEPQHPSHSHDSYFTPVHCGNTDNNCIPVVLSGPKDAVRDGRYVCLLKIDQSATRAKWLNTLPDGSPRTLLLDEYSQFHSFSSLPPGGIRINSDGEIVHDLSPLIYDCAWIDNHWFLYVTGYTSTYVRYGIPLGVLTRNFIDLTLLKPIFKSQEQSFGQVCTSLDRMIVSPLHANGPHKGKQTILLFQNNEEDALILPRGYSKFQVLEYFSGHYWLTPRPMEYNTTPLTILTCTGS